MNFSSAKRLTHLQGNCLSAVFSPDGDYIAFSCAMGRRTDIYLIRPDGTDLTCLTNQVTVGEESVYSYFDPNFSPDGLRLVCVRADIHCEEDFNICVLDISTGTEQLLTDTGADSNPSFSPDGQYIVFLSERDTANEKAHLNEIYRMRADGTEPTRLTHTEFLQSEKLVLPPTNHHPCYSPDGEYIAFTSSVHGGRGENRFEVCRMDADGANPTRLTHTEGSSSHLLWHPDGSRIVFTCWSRLGDARKNKNDIYCVNADGSDQFCLEASDAVNRPRGFSPDGRYLAFDSSREGRSANIVNNWDIYLRDMDGGGLVRVTDNIVLDRHPAFSPDGASLLFQSRRDGWDELYVAAVTP